MHRFADCLKRGVPQRNRLAALGVATLPAHATNYRVGADAQCDYTTIAAAITAASAQQNGSFPKIYIATNQSYSNQALSINRGLQSHISLIGGVPNCGTTTS